MKDHDTYSSINVSHDMTRDGRKHTRALVEKAKKHTQELAQNDKNASKKTEPTKSGDFRGTNGST